MIITNKLNSILGGSMIITNKLNLPAPMAQALTLKERERKPMSISVTEFIMPPRIKHLRERHKNEMETDVSDNLWLLLGSCVHDLLARMDVNNALSEEKLEKKFGEWTVTGRPDLYTDDGVIYDFKITSAWTIVFEKGGRWEWEEQLNCYAHLLRHAGFEVKALKIIAILRDWSETKSLDNGYPKANIHVLDIRMWPDGEAEKFIGDRVLFHDMAGYHDDESLPLCTADERWEKPAQYRIEKEGRKTAVRVLDSEEEAKKYMAESDDKKLKLVVKAGESTRCKKNYCGVAKFCSYAKAHYASVET